jgi:hypothetical protein
MSQMGQKLSSRPCYSPFPVALLRSRKLPAQAEFLFILRIIAWTSRDYK